MPAAYILISLNISVDYADTLALIRGIHGVTKADLVVGPDDCIAFVEAEDTSQMMVAIKSIRSIEGVEKTDTRSIAEM